MQVLRALLTDFCMFAFVDGSPTWIQKVVAKVTTDDEKKLVNDAKYRTRVLT